MSSWDGDTKPLSRLVEQMLEVCYGLFFFSLLVFVILFSLQVIANTPGGREALLGSDNEEEEENEEEKNEEEQLFADMGTVKLGDGKDWKKERAFL